MKGRSVVPLLVPALLTVLAIGAIWTQIVPQYQARGEVRVRPFIRRLVFQTDENGPIPFYEGFVNTQVAVMRSMTVLNRVLDQKEVQYTQWYKEPKQSALQRLRGQTDTPMERLRDALSVQPRRRTEIIDISFSDASAKDAVVIVNAVLDQYIEYIGYTSNAEANELFRQLVEQYNTLDSEIVTLEDVVAGLRESLGTATPQELISARRIRLDETEARLSELQLSMATLESQINQANAADSNEVALVRADKQPQHHEDKEWRTQDVKVRTIRHNIATSQLDPSDPEIVQARKDLKFATELLRLRETQLGEQWRNRRAKKEGATSPEQQLVRIRQEEKFLRAEFEKQQADFAGLFASAQELEKEEIALQHKRELFDVVRRHREEKDIERGVTGSISVLMRAFSPSEPSEDRRILFTAIVLGLSLVVGSGIVFLQKTRAAGGGKGRRK